MPGKLSLFASVPVALSVCMLCYGFPNRPILRGPASFRSILSGSQLSAEFKEAPSLPFARHRFSSAAPPGSPAPRSIGFAELVSMIPFDAGTG